MIIAVADENSGTDGDVLGDAVAVGLGVEVAVCVGVGVGVATTGVGVGVATLAKLAVIVPGPLIVAIVEESDGISNDTLPELEDHEENL